MTNVNLDTFDNPVIDAIIEGLKIPFSSDVSVVEVWKTIEEFGTSHNWEVWDGVLLMDGRSLKRVGSKVVHSTIGDDPWLTALEDAYYDELEIDG